MRKAIGGNDVSQADVIDATDYVVPAIEILDTRILRSDPETGKTRIIFDTISDNAANAGIVLGKEQHAIDAFDLRWVGALAYCNNELEETGLGAGVLDNPIESVVWLARRMAQYGQSIEPGQIILSGSFIRPVECPPGSQIRTDFALSDTAIADIIDVARERWMLGDASIELVAARENYVFCVKTSVASYALRLHRQGYRSVEEIHSELSWMFRLAVKQIPVPNPVSAVDGNSVQIIKGVIVDMLTWLDGTRLSEFQATEEIYFQLGSLLAQMHIATDSWEPPDTFSRPTWDLAGSQPTWGRFWSNPLLTSDQKDRFLEFRENACSALEKLQQPDCGLIHADLVPDNVLY